METIFVTADQIGAQSGGGLVTAQELAALSSFSSVHYFDQTNLGVHIDPWGADRVAAVKVAKLISQQKISLAHFYSGSFPRTVHALKAAGIQVSYTIAAHEKSVSQEEFKRCGIPFAFPHLTDPLLWKQYTQGYREADLIICPAELCARIVDKYGPEMEFKPVKIIPHGCDPNPDLRIARFPQKFTVGYLGAYGPDKGVRYLLQAWQHMPPDMQLLLAGRDSKSLEPTIKAMGLKNVFCLGWQEDVNHFYGELSVYVQPSVTEGFGIEVPEAWARGRATIVADGAGVAEYVNLAGLVVRSGDHESLAKAILEIRESYTRKGALALELSKRFSWKLIREAYTYEWKELMNAEPKPVERHTKPLKLNIGCFTTQFKDWLNIDILPVRLDPASQCDFIQHDCRKPLPFENESADMIYSHHFLEHLTFEEGRKFLKEAFRVLKPGHLIKVVVPNAKKLMSEYLTDELGRYDHLKTIIHEREHPTETIFRLLMDNHKAFYDGSLLETVMEDVGFRVVDRESIVNADLKPLEMDTMDVPEHRELSLVVVARK